MKIIKSSLFLICFLIIIIVLWSNFDTNKQNDVSSLALPQNHQALLPNEVDNPLGSGQEVSFNDAQSKVQYSIPLPDKENIAQVWVSTSPEDPSVSSIAIRFESGLLLIIHKTHNSPPDWEKTIEIEPIFEKVDINGNYGMGTSPGIKEIRGETYSYPGSVEWWANGLDITLYSDVLPLEKLVEIATGMQTMNPVPAQKESLVNTPSPEATVQEKPTLTATP